MSHIPQPKSALSKPPTSKVHKPVQGGGGTTTTASGSTTGLVKPRGTPAKPPTGSKISPSSTKGVVKPRGAASSTSTSEPTVSPRGSIAAMATSSQTQPRISRENSATKLGYRRETSSSSLRSSGSETQLSLKRESSQSSIKRRGSSSSQPSPTSAEELRKFFKLGDRVLVSGSKPGVIAFIGETKFAKGDWAGVILDDPMGKNDGSVAGVRYFECKPLHGMFTKLEKITKVNRIPETPPSPVDSSSLELGDRVVVSGTKIGTLRYVGTTGFAKGDWAGVELDEPLGKNDGAVAGTRYFQCMQGFGLFAPVHKVIRTGKKEALKLTSPPVKKEPSLPLAPQLLHETIQNSLAHVANGGSESSISSTASTPVSTASSALGLALKTDEQELSSAKSPARPAPTGQISLQVAALQEALQDREKQIQALLEERDFERIEIANATNQVSKAEEELANIKKKHDLATVDYTKSIQSLKELIELAEKEKSDLHAQVEEERRKNEDLQFKLEEEEITLGDELQTEEKQIQDLQKKLHQQQEVLQQQKEMLSAVSGDLEDKAKELEDKVQELEERNNDIELLKTEKEAYSTRMLDFESQLMAVSDELSSTKEALEESRRKVVKLEGTVSAADLMQSSSADQTLEELKEKQIKIHELEQEVANNKQSYEDLQTDLEFTKTELQSTVEENESLHKQVEDLTDNLSRKDEEFVALSGEIEHIKQATLDLQKQLTLSEARSEHLTIDKSKLVGLTVGYGSNLIQPNATSFTKMDKRLYQS